MEVTKVNGERVVSFIGVNKTGKEATLKIASSQGLTMWLTAVPGRFTINKRPRANPDPETLLRIIPDFFKPGSVSQTTQVEVWVQNDGKMASKPIFCLTLTKDGRMPRTH